MFASALAEVGGKVAGIAELRFYDAGEIMGIAYYPAMRPSYREIGDTSKAS